MGLGALEGLELVLQLPRGRQLLRVKGGQLMAHAVHVRRQGTQLVPVRDIGHARELALGDPLEGHVDLSDRVHDGPRDQGGEPHRDNEGKEQEHTDRPVGLALLPNDLAEPGLAIRLHLAGQHMCRVFDLVPDHAGEPDVELVGVLVEAPLLAARDRLGGNRHGRADVFLDHVFEQPLTARADFHRWARSLRRLALSVSEC